MLTAEMKSALAATLESRPSTLAITLRYNDVNVSLDKIRHDIRSLHARIDRQIFGRRFHLSTIRTQGWFIVEKLADAPHLHGALTLSPANSDMFSAMLDTGTWKAVAGLNAEHKVERYGRGWATYATKSILDTSHLILCGDFTPSRG